MQPFFSPDKEDASEWEESLPSDFVETLWRWRMPFQSTNRMHASQRRGRIPGWARMVHAHAQALETGTPMDHFPMSSRKAGKYARASVMARMKKEQPEVYMQLLEEDDDPFTDVSSFSETEMIYGWHVPPWRDSNFFEGIPNMFTVDLDNLTKEEEECKCSGYTEDEEDFQFFPSRGFQWNSQEGRESLDSDESKTTCRYDPGLVVCVGRDEPLGVSTANNRVHVRIGGDMRVKGDKVVFTIRSFSTGDPSSVNFSSGVGAVNTDYSNDESWDRAKECLRICRDEHNKCRYRDNSSRASGFKPTRLIDIGRDDDCPPRLVRGESLTLEDVKNGYISLSYCWGGHNDQNTTTFNVDMRYDDGFPLKSQPATIQDAILATRKLGFRYLWIDSICITQDDSNDLLTEIAHMDKIYEHADLLISASRAASMDHGFLQPIVPEDVEKAEIEFSVPFKYRYQGETGRVVLEKWFESRSDLAPDPIHSRGWTLQEHLMSKRILSFNTTGLSWQCLCDSMFGAWKKSVYTDKSQVLSSPSNMVCRNMVLVLDDRGRNKGRRSNPYQYETVREEWDGLVNNFCLRHLTKPSDRLPAFSAIPKQFTYAFGSAKDYVAGHWKCHLPTDLLWHNSSFVKDRDDPFPTWSWASCKYSAGKSTSRGSTDLRIPFFDEMFMTAVMSVEEIDVHFVNPSDSFGDVRYARLLVAAPLVPVDLTFKRVENEGDGESFMVIEGAEYGIKDALWLADGSDRPRFQGNLDGYYRRSNEKRLMRQSTGKGGGYYLAEILRYKEKLARGNPSSRGLILRRSRHRDKRGRERFRRFGTYWMTYLNYDEDSYTDEFPSSESEGEEEDWETVEGDDEDALATGSDINQVSAELHEEKCRRYPFDGVDIKMF
ncbi:hypothetical protein FHL15_011400 [Xylaria flabelliformis]|uniref:Heterokaryon incompatibility domain-containing protein n=1 Tax=Xylaria flabelliformis TaxID=2512241 RepID=A0A553HID6_9PEZI|nr:hypothetical protein FHL15_011400 [Xylaria flabelliformis]